MKSRARRKPRAAAAADDACRCRATGAAAAQDDVLRPAIACRPARDYGSLIKS